MWASGSRAPSVGLLWGFWGWDLLRAAAVQLGWRRGVCGGLSAPLAPCEEELSSREPAGPQMRAMPSHE